VGRGFESLRWLQTDTPGGVPERPKGTDCKSVGEAFGGSNPPPTTIRVYRVDVGDIRFRSRLELHGFDMITVLMDRY
jgi:hypothetical protein